VWRKKSTQGGWPLLAAAGELVLTAEAPLTARVFGKLRPGPCNESLMVELAAARKQSKPCTGGTLWPPRPGTQEVFF